MVLRCKAGRFTLGKSNMLSTYNALRVGIMAGKVFAISWAMAGNLRLYSLAFYLGRVSCNNKFISLLLQMLVCCT